MIDIIWEVRIDCTGGQFSVPDGTPASEIDQKINEIVENQIRIKWSPHVGGEKDALEGVFTP